MRFRMRHLDTGYALLCRLAEKLHKGLVLGQSVPFELILGHLGSLKTGSISCLPRLDPHKSAEKKGLPGASHDLVP